MAQFLSPKYDDRTKTTQIGETKGTDGTEFDARPSGAKLDVPAHHQLLRALCERALLENADAEAAPYFLSGIAAADGLLSIARLLHRGDQGWFTCSSCGAGYAFIRFGERIAV